LFDAWARLAGECVPDEADDLWNLVVSAEPDRRAPLTESELERALELIADYADLKSPWFSGHSRGVAQLAAEAGRHAGLPLAEVTTLRRAALLHDIGRNGVPNSIWDKPGPLTADELERVRLHAYYTERVLHRSKGLSRLASVASSAHERGNGSGYPRAVGVDALPVLGRYLEAADAYHAMGEDRPHRPALPRTQAASELRRGVRSGAFDGTAVAAVLAAAGHVTRKRTPSPAGLSAREIDVLVLLSRGLTNREIGARLGITAKTASNFVARIYTKTGVSSRAEAALFAMRHGLLPDADL
jgi:HD-GYP domain-containing protein (c-di-GMP phosphodiesterase class II)